MKQRIMLDPDHTHDHAQTHLKKSPDTKAKAMNQKTQKVAAKAHRKSNPK